MNDISVWDLFNGVAVIIDDEIGKDESVGEKDTCVSVEKIAEELRKKNIVCATYDNIPSQDVIESMKNISFLIMDWKFSVSSSGTSVGSALAQENENRVISFLKIFLEKTFAPVFLFTNEETLYITEKLSNEKIYDHDKVNRIFVCEKSKVATLEDIEKEISGWMRQMPAAYVFKEWDRVVTETKNKFFIDMYGYSSRWVKIIWDMLKMDSTEFCCEFGEFITRNLLSRVEKFVFDENIVGVCKDEHMDDELGKVIEGDRYLVYGSQQPEQPYTGDLFKKGGKYYLNIRAQCDISRKDKKTDKYRDLYLITGEVLNLKRVITDYIKMTDEKLEINSSFSVQINEMCEFCKNAENIKKINGAFRKYRDDVFFRKGIFLERNDKVIIDCIAGKQALEFGLGIEIGDFDKWKDNRIGRILPPYITRIQQKCAQNMVREGVMPTPKVLFTCGDD